mgnify:CR=1 FL=1
MKIYLWTEDSQSGLEFWKLLTNTLYRHKEIIVETKNNCTELANAVTLIPDNSKDIYLIALDNAKDNTSTSKTYNELISYLENNNKTNIHLIDMISFEYIFLNFKYLIDWTFDIIKGDDLYNKRTNWIAIRAAFLQSVNKSYTNNSDTDYKNIEMLKDNMKNLGSYTVESCATKIIKEITKNTGFAINKDSENEDEHFGYCYKHDCDYIAEINECAYSNYKDSLSKKDPEPEDCGLRYIKNIDNTWEKMYEIFKDSSFYNQFINILGKPLSNQVYMATKVRTMLGK